MAEKWSSKSTVKFVEIYGKHPCLWDLECNEYKNKQARDTALQELVDEMDVDGFDITSARRKIRIIRSTYWNEKSKITKSIKAGATIETVYKPKIPWFPVADSFLKKITNWGENQSNLVVNMTTTNGQVPLPKKYPPTVSRLANLQKNKNSIEAKHKKRKKDLFMENAIKVLQDISQTVTEETEFDAFGKNIALQLKQLPLKDALELQIQIQNIIAQRRFRVLHEQNTLHTTMSYNDGTFFPNNTITGHHQQIVQNNNPSEMMLN